MIGHVVSVPVREQASLFWELFFSPAKELLGHPRQFWADRSQWLVFGLFEAVLTAAWWVLAGLLVWASPAFSGMLWGWEICGLVFLAHVTLTSLAFSVEYRDQLRWKRVLKGGEH